MFRGIWDADESEGHRGSRPGFNACWESGRHRGAWHGRGHAHDHETEHAHNHAHAGRGSWGGRRHGGPPGWFGDFFGPPPRAERGNVRYLVLDAIATQPRHGYEIIQAIEERSGGAYRPSPGVVYPTLQLLEELGHAHMVERESRKVFGITEEGKRDLDAHKDEVSEFYEQCKGESWERNIEDFGDLMRRAARLFKTFRRSAQHGRISAAAQAKIRKVLDEAVTRIEQILDEDSRV
jgi:DNA-binding PadR family transcriptional regulator